MLAIPYTQAPHAVRQHADELAGTVLVDVTNPVDVSVFEPLDVAPFRSGAEVIADVAPDGVPVVKAFNTAFAGTLVAGLRGRRSRSTSSSPATTRTRRPLVARLVRDGGMRPIEAGPLARARELEALGYLHMVVQGPLETHFASAVKVVA